MIKQILVILILLGSIVGGYSEVSSVQIMEQAIDAENAKIFCRTIGKGNPVIVIHGGPGSGQDHLLPQFYALAKNNFLIFYDQRGAGKSTGEINEDTMSVAMFVKDLEVLRKTFNYNKVSLLRHSWGSFVAMCYAIEHPERVEKLVLSNPCPASYDDFSLFEKNRAFRLSDFQEEITKIQDTQDYQRKDVSG